MAVSLLITRGANRNAVDDHGCSAADAAQTSGFPKLADCIRGLLQAPPAAISPAGFADRSVIPVAPAAPASNATSADSKPASAVAGDDPNASPAKGGRSCCVM